MTVALAFIRRDWLRLASYRLLILWRVIGMLALIAIIYLIGTALGSATRFPGAGTGYVQFLLAGIAFTDIFTTTMQALPGSIREAQLTGTLEPMLLTPVSTARFVWASSLFSILQSLLRVAIVITVAVLGFGYWTHANVFTAAIIFIPACAAFAGLGLLSASFVLAFKQDDPVVAIFALVGSLVGGMLFPVSALPTWLQGAAYWLPLTHALQGMRLGLQGAGPAAVVDDALTLVVMSVAALAVAMGIGRFAFTPILPMKYPR
jgi:ABC-2 type transport system permease protein